MNLLAVDTATEKLSVALFAGGEKWYFSADAGLRHSDLLTDITDLLMKKAALKPEQLSGVVCMDGPGSFTGLRIGFSFAKGLALSLSIPFAAIPTLDCMARPFSFWPGIIMPVIDAKKGAFFCTLFNDGKRLCPDMDITPAKIFSTVEKQGAEAANRVLLVGPGAGLFHEKLSGMPANPPTPNPTPYSPNPIPQTLFPKPYSPLPIPYSLLYIGVTL